MRGGDSTVTFTLNKADAATFRFFSDREGFQELLRRVGARRSVCGFLFPIQGKIGSS